MANEIDNRLIVVGLKESPYEFAKHWKLRIYGTAVPMSRNNLFVGIANGAFEYVTKWEPKIGALVELSKRQADYAFFAQLRRLGDPAQRPGCHSQRGRTRVDQPAWQLWFI